jgi:hypothetical protein
MAQGYADIAVKGPIASELLEQLGQRHTARLTLDSETGETTKKRRSTKSPLPVPIASPSPAKPKRKRRSLWYLVRRKADDSDEIGEVLEAVMKLARETGPAQALEVLNIAADTQLPELAESKAEPVSDYKQHEAQRWAETRKAFLSEYPSVTAPELAELTGSKAKNPSSRAHSWAKAGAIFSVHDGSGERFPLFQVHEGKPLPQIAELLLILRPKLSNWQVALWLTTPNAWVGDWRTPLSLLGSAPEVVIDAARHEVAEKVF